MDNYTLYKFFEGKATIEERLLIKEWAQSSPANRQKLLQERKIYDMTTLLKKKPVARVNIRSRIADSILWKVASVLFLLLSIYLYLQLPGREDEIIAMQTITVPAGQRININLPDGTNVWLNARTTLRYPVNFNKQERMVELDGEAYFDVTSSDAKPFLVNTSAGIVKVRGTIFNVEAYSSDEKFETTLIKGSVEVSTGDESGNSLILEPGYKSILRNGILEREEVMDYDHYRWKEGLICFRNESFSGLTKAFEKYYGKKIEVQNEKLLQDHYTGKFRQIEGIDHALRVLQKDLEFTYTRDDDEQIIYIK